MRAQSWPQTAMYLLRRYACDKESSVVLLHWLQPFEDFAYRFSGDLASLKQAEKLQKSIIGRSDFSHSDLIIDRMVLLIREELHHFCQVLEIMQARGDPIPEYQRQSLRQNLDPEL